MTPLQAIERIAREDGHLFDTSAPNGGAYCMSYGDRCDEGAPEGMAAHGPDCGPEHDWGCDCGWAEAVRVLRDLAEEDEHYVEPPSPKIWEGLPKERKVTTRGNLAQALIGSELIDRLMEYARQANPDTMRNEDRRQVAWSWANRISDWLDESSGAWPATNE